MSSTTPSRLKQVPCVKWVVLEVRLDDPGKVAELLGAAMSVVTNVAMAMPRVEAKRHEAARMALRDVCVQLLARSGPQNSEWCQVRRALGVPPTPCRLAIGCYLRIAVPFLFLRDCMNSSTARSIPIPHARPIGCARLWWATNRMDLQRLLESRMWASFRSARTPRWGTSDQSRLRTLGYRHRSHRFHIRAYKFPHSRVRRSAWNHRHRAFEYTRQPFLPVPRRRCTRELRPN